MASGEEKDETNKQEGAKRQPCPTPGCGEDLSPVFQSSLEANYTHVMFMMTAGGSGRRGQPATLAVQCPNCRQLAVFDVPFGYIRMSSRR